MFEQLGIGDRVPGAERVVASALDAYEAGRWEEMYDFTDRETLARLMKRWLRNKAERVRRHAHPPVPAWEPLSPLEEEVREFARMAAELPVTFHELARVECIEDAQALTPREFLARWAEARLDVERRVPTDLPDCGRIVIGSVAILPDYAMVVTRTTNATSSQPLALIGQIGVIGDGRGEWRLDADSHWLGLAHCIIR